MMRLPHRYTHRVRFRECDPMGVAYHAHFVDWFEYGRTEALRSVGIPYKEVQDSGISLPVIDLALKYHRSAYYDDLLVIETTPSLSSSGLKLTCAYRVLRESDQSLLATGHVTLCFLQNGRTRPIPAPPVLREALQSEYE